MPGVTRTSNAEPFRDIRKTRQWIFSAKNSHSKRLDPSVTLALLNDFLKCLQKWSCLTRLPCYKTQVESHRGPLAVARRGSSSRFSLLVSCLKVVLLGKLSGRQSRHNNSEEHTYKHHLFIDLKKVKNTTVREQISIVRTRETWVTFDKVNSESLFCACSATKQLNTHLLTGFDINDKYLNSWWQEISTHRFRKVFQMIDFSVHSVWRIKTLVKKLFSNIKVWTDLFIQCVMIC